MQLVGRTAGKTPQKPCGDEDEEQVSILGGDGLEERGD